MDTTNDNVSCETTLDKLESLHNQATLLLEDVIKMRKICADNLISIMEGFTYELVKSLCDNSNEDNSVWKGINTP